VHIKKNVCDSLLGIILSINGKNKDIDKARIDLQNMGIRKELHLYKDGDQWMKPYVAYTLTKTEKHRFCEFLKSIRFPNGFLNYYTLTTIQSSFSSVSGSTLGQKEEEFNSTRIE